MALTKIVSPSGWDFGQQPLNLLKVSSRGLIGNDRREFLKSASHALADQIDRIKFAADEVPFHLIALGASEAYGPNRNGDGFKEAACRGHHNTFVKFAKFFRNHRNKAERGDPFYGVVKASAYNEEMRRVELLCALNATKTAADRNGGFVADAELEKIARGESLPVSMACVTDPTYPVLTRDEGYKPISEIAVGDHVWTKEGRWRRVYQLNRRKYTGEVRTFHINGLPRPVELTADHPMWAKVFAGSREKAAVKAKAQRYFRDSEVFNNQPAGWHHAEHVEAGDRFFYIPVTRYSGYGAISDQRLAAILGYYVAEGSFGYNGDVACTTEFSCNLSDSLPRRVPKLLSTMYPEITVKIEPKKNSESGLAVLVHSTEFSEFLRNYVGNGVSHKQIPPEVFNADVEIKLAFLGAWLDGDGWLDKKGAHYSSSNYNLVLQGRDLLASIGIPSSIYKIDHTKCKTSGYAGSGVEYTLNVSHLDNWRLSEHSEKVATYPVPESTRTKPSTMRYCPDGTYAYRIKQVDSRQVFGVETYNFEVEDDESYSLGGLVSHNCRVPNDVCSFCKHAARNREEYCTREKCAAGGCRDNLTRLVKVAGDLHHLHVDNPDPTWFDISRVFRPADRIAYGAKADYLTKAASDGDLFDLSDYIKMAEHSTAPLEVILYQSGHLGTWSEKYASQVRLGYGLASLEGQEQLPTGDYARALATKPFPVEKLASYGSEQCDGQLSALADRQIILNLRDYARLTDREASSKSAAAILPGTYRRMTDNESLPLQVEGGACAFAEKTANESARLLAAATYEEHSLGKQAAENRNFLSCIREQPSPAVVRFEKSAACDEQAEQLAQDYAMYKLAALWRAASSDCDFPLTVKLSLRQNQVLL